jgi:endoribonuclease Dicer
VYVHLLSLGLQEHFIEDKESSSPEDGGGCDGEREEATLEGKEPDIDALEPPKVLGDLLESIAGAIFVDSNLSLSAVWRVFQPLFEEKIGTHTHTHTHLVPSLA